MPQLQLSTAEFRRLADKVVAAGSELFARVDDGRTVPSTSGDMTEAAFDRPAPEQGTGEGVLDDLQMLNEHSRLPTARLFPYVIGSGEPVAAFGDFYASLLNQNVTAWRSSPAAVAVERTVVRWLAEAIGCGGFSGSLTSGGSLANLMGLAMAREARAPANEEGAQPCIVYASEEVHMSIPKALALIGVGRANLRLIPVDEHFRIMLPALIKAVEADRREGRQAIAVVASAGTISTGAIDPLLEVAEVARTNDLWLHVDGAYGALAALADPAKLNGLDRADSISLDPHKWLYQPLDCSLLLYRDAGIARQTFSYTDDYARALSDHPVEGFAFFEESVELSRRFRALKLWLSLRYHGLAAFRAAIAENLRQAQLLAELIRSQPSLELLAPVELSAVCFRWTDADEEELNRRNEEILRGVATSGRVALSNATIRGKFALRACIVNHRTTDDDIHEVIREVLAVAER
jgi:aromatic-L-amino-acid decarboxylase